MTFEAYFHCLTGFMPLAWQARIYNEYLSKGLLPSAVDIPTGLGKTSVMALWLLARASGAMLPRRLVYVVDRRAVVDQATDVAEGLRSALNGEGQHFGAMSGTDLQAARQDASRIKANLLGTARQFAISTLRGQFADNREWQSDPSTPAIIIGTVDMIGSRLLFEGYGISRGMRPFHAGLLGADTVLVLDEAHLVSPFEKLIEQIESDADTYGARTPADRTLIPPLRLISLSATGGERIGSIFRLGEMDQDEITQRRLNAAKALRFVPATDARIEERIADNAWALSSEGKAPVRVIVFCNSRETAERIHKALSRLIKSSRISGLESPELFVGARRGKEREDAKKRLVELGFIAGGDTPATARFLIATSAGEVGVDLDADHLVCDLVPYERMVQRFGRVNRRGRDGLQASLVVIDEFQPKPTEGERRALDRTADKRSEREKRAAAAYEARLVPFRLKQGAKSLLSTLPALGESLDASPGALLQLKSRVGADVIRAASTPPPLRPALNRAVVDAWSMTSLKDHPGRPEVAPWLRGWTEDTPQTTVIWRSHLPVMADGTPFHRKTAEDFFLAAPPTANERLEAETRRVVDWLRRRLARQAAMSSGNAYDVLGFLLSPAGELRETLMRHAYSGEDKAASDRWEALRGSLSDGTLIVSATIGGLRDGLLDDAADAVPPCGDTDTSFATSFSVSVFSGPSGPDNSLVSFSHAISTNEDEAAGSQWLIVERGESEDRKALSEAAQFLDDHQDWARAAAQEIATRIDLPQSLAAAITLAARLHDEGKRSNTWQRAFNAPKVRGEDGALRPYGKTKGPINQLILNHYRHEFGSLPHAEDDAEFRRLDPESQDLVLHLIASHHGNARPLIDTRGSSDASPLLLRDRARDVALRFARLQKRFGPWGLAWLEALVRSADQQASRRLEEATHG